MKWIAKKNQENKMIFKILLVIVVFDEFDDDILFGLDLEHLHDKAHEGSGLAVAAVSSADVVQLHCLVDQRLRRQSEALFLPVRILVYLGP